MNKIRPEELQEAHVQALLDHGALPFRGQRPERLAVDPLREVDARRHGPLRGRHVAREARARHAEVRRLREVHVPEPRRVLRLLAKVELAEQPRRHLVDDGRVVRRAAPEVLEPRQQQADGVAVERDLVDDARPAHLDRDGGVVRGRGLVDLGEGCGRDGRVRDLFQFHGRAGQVLLHGFFGDGIRKGPVRVLERLERRRRLLPNNIRPRRQRLRELHEDDAELRHLVSQSRAPRRRAGPLADGPRFPRRLLVEVVGAAAAPGGVAPRHRRGDGREAPGYRKRSPLVVGGNAGDLLVERLAVRENERFEFGRLVLLLCNCGGMQSRAVTSRRR
mmetsp:Transcript_18517/g.55356  ORF Transcript_18517/g.55356 Transcript_18517/m.55356 type:complete len:333 (+) Transcript_18517:485-1483(+)